MFKSSILLSASLASLALAKTDLTGCTSTDVSSPAGASVAWYVPGTGEVCAFLDCGGGTAPPKTAVPGCPLYSGTATYSPSYLPGYGSATSAPSAPGAYGPSSTTSAAMTTASPVSSTAVESASETSTVTSAPVPVVNTTATAPSSYAVNETSVAASSALTTALPVSGNYTGPLTNTTTPVAGIPAPSGVALGGTAASGGMTSGVATTGVGSNSTVVSPTVSASSPTGSSAASSAATTASAAGAMQTAQVWVGSVGLIGFGAIIAAL